MLIFDETHKTDIANLDEYETPIFILFLESERIRHIDDVVEIEKKIKYLRDKYNLS